MRNSIRDHLSDVPVRAGLAANRTRTAASNTWYRAAGRRISGARTRVSNARNLRAIQRGHRDIPARIGDQVRSRTPVVRDRINRATGRPHRDDREMGRASDRTLARLAEGQRSLRDAEARNRASRQRAPRAEDNQRHVRETLADRQPETARKLERAARAVSPHAGRSPR